MSNYRYVCSKCGKDVNKNANNCKYCGNGTYNVLKRKSYYSGIATVICVLAIAVLIYIVLDWFGSHFIK